jgi:transposase
LQNKAEYADKVKRLHTLLYLAEAGIIKLYFGDESGFSLTPGVPYGWIKKGEYACILSQRSARVNVFGLLSTDHDLHTYQNSGSLNAQFIIESLDNFARRMIKPTVLVLDNASIHSCQLFKARREEWEQKGLYLFFLPKYSPHLNRIKRLWKQVKYHWLKAEDYLSLQVLKNALQSIFTEFGTSFNLHFKKLDLSKKPIPNFD